MNDLALAEVRQLGQTLETQFIPQRQLVIDVLKNVVGKLVLGDADEVLPALETASLADPNGLLLVSPQIDHLAELFQSHLLVPQRVVLQLLHQRRLQVGV
jgi:hypothetical protein